MTIEKILIPKNKLNFTFFWKNIQNAKKLLLILEKVSLKNIKINKIVFLKISYYKIHFQNYNKKNIVQK